MADKKISELPYLGSTGYTLQDIMPIVTYFSSVTGDTVYTYLTDFKGVIEVTYSELTTLIGSNGLIQGSYYSITDFETIYDLPDYFPDGNPRTNIVTLNEGVEPIIIFATSTNTISTDAYQIAYPFDKIKYDYTWSSTEINGTPTTGRISERIDEWNNRTDYDHRRVEFKRYQSYFLNNQLTGTISDYDCTTGVVIGVDTLFLSEVIPGDVLLFNSKNSLGYYIGVKVVNVNSDTSIDAIIDSSYSGTIFTGDNMDFYSSYQTGVNLEYKEVYVGQSDQGDYTSVQTFKLDGYTLNNYIGDTSNFYINNSSPIGLSFLLSNNTFDSKAISNVSGVLMLNNSLPGKTTYNKVSDFFYNNTITKSFAQNNIGDNFNNNIISGDMIGNHIGFNFNNNILLYKALSFNQIKNNFESNSFYDSFTKNIIGDDFYGNIFFNLVNQNQIGNGFESNIFYSNFEFNIIDEGFVGNQITNNKAEFVNNHIGNYFSSNIIGNNFSSNQIGNYFGDKSKTGVSNLIGTEFKNNKIGDYFGSDGNNNPLGNNIGVVTTISFTNLQSVPSGITLTNGGTGYIDSTNVSTIGGAGSSLTVDIFTDGLGVITGVTINTPGTYYSIGDSITINAGGADATFDITGVTSFTIGNSIDNGLGSSCEVVTVDTLSSITVNVLIGDIGIGDTIDNNSDTSAIVSSIDYVIFSNGSMQDNVIGNHFINNQIGLEFNNNQIGNYFGNDKSTDISNIILDNFQNNIIANYFGIDVETPSIGEGGNIIRNNFIGNTIGDSFTYNITFDTSGGGYNDNNLGFGFNNNVFGDGFNSNKIGDLFQFNLINDYFAGNEIGYFFNSNQIDSNAGFNKIGPMSWFNQIGTGFESNKTGVSFFGNTIGVDFVHNTIGNYFGQFFLAGNTWGDNVYDNQFGDHTYDNDVLSNFNNNNIFNNFIGNIVGDDFQSNIIQTEINGYDFTSNPATHVYLPYNCTLYLRKTGGLGGDIWLRYYDSSNGITFSLIDL
jgi:hypothetical protein